MTKGEQRKITLTRAFIIMVKSLTLTDIVRGIVLTAVIVVFAFFFTKLSAKDIKEEKSVNIANVEQEIVLKENAVNTVKEMASNVENTVEEVSEQEKMQIQQLKVQQEQTPKYSEYEKMALAKIIYAEAGGVYSEKCKKQAAEAGITSDIWQQLVGYVVMNRLDSKYYPDTIEGVLKNGYAQESIDKFYAGYYDENSVRNAEIVLENYYNVTIPVPRNLVYQAEFKQGTIYLHVGNTYFGLDANLEE